MSLRAIEQVAVAGVVALATSLMASSARAEPLPEGVRNSVAKSLLDGALAALDGKRKKAFRKLERAATLAPEIDGVQGALGAAALMYGRHQTAARVLKRVPELAAYHAMAVAHERGGLSKAKTVLSAHVRDAETPDPATAFMVALAFAASGQAERADRLLAKAVAGAGPLSEAFAPDPAVAMTRQVLVALRALERVGDARARLAVVLVSAGRRAEAARLAKAALEDEGGRAAALRTLVRIDNTVHTRRALGHVRRVLALEPDAPDALVAQVVLRHRLGHTKYVRSAIESLPPVDDPYLKWELHRARAEVALADGDVEAAIEAAEGAIRADPKEDASLALLVRGLLAAHKIDRAKAFAKELLKRKPIDVDPFDLLAKVADAKRRPSRAKEMRLRSRGYRGARAQLESQVKRREEVFKVVRDISETGVGITALSALRGEDPSLALPVDLAIAKHGTRGSQRSARDRILARCKGSLGALLRNRGSWDRVSIVIAPYGIAKSVTAPLTAADPQRCAGARLVK